MNRDRYGSNYGAASLASGCPITVGIIGLQFVAMVLFNLHFDLNQWLTCGGLPQLAQPWRFVTFALASYSLISWFWLAGAYYVFGSSLERSWGGRTFATFLLLVTVATSVSVAVGAALLHRFLDVPGTLVVAAMGVAWGALNLEETITFWFLPLTGKMVAVLCAVYAAFTVASATVLLIPFALVGCGCAVLWVTRRPWAMAGTWQMPRRRTGPRLRLVPGTKRATPADDRFSLRDLNPLEWLARRKRARQFEKLMKDD